MATLVGNDGQVTIAGQAVVSTRNFSVDMTSDTIETTTMGVDVRTYVKGMSSWSGSADIYFNTDDYQANTIMTSTSAAAIGNNVIPNKRSIRKVLYRRQSHGLPLLEQALRAASSVQCVPDQMQSSR